MRYLTSYFNLARFPKLTLFINSTFYTYVLLLGTEEIEVVTGGIDASIAEHRNIEGNFICTDKNI